jgi:hypothetical protein
MSDRIALLADGSGVMLWFDLIGEFLTAGVAAPTAKSTP